MTALNKQALREKFEAWAEEAGALPWGYLKKQRNASGNYSVQIYTYMWHAWSACHESLMDALEAAEKRIAELERNEIREEGNQFLVVRHPGKLPVVKHCAGELEGFLRQLLEHDPMATIDIVTHRYYGVGGQWVQDADEYLQMMATAAGKGE